MSYKTNQLSQERNHVRDLQDLNHMQHQETNQVSPETHYDLSPETYCIDRESPETYERCCWRVTVRDAAYVAIKDTANHVPGIL
jgi:hypothetical protein